MCRFEGVEGGGHRRSALAFVREAQDEQHDNNSEEVLVRHAMVFSVLLLTAACASQQVTPTSSGGGTSTSRANVIGAETSKALVEGFLSAAKAADLQRMSTLWGNDKGLARENPKITRDAFEKRLVIMQCLLQHDRWNFAESTPRLQTGGRQAWRVTLTKNKVSSTTTILTVAGPNGRWLLEDVDVTKLQANCT